MTLVESERHKYQTVWCDDQYRVVSPGMRHLESALEWMMPEDGASFTDWGCGTGRAAEQLAARGFGVQLVDIASNAYNGALPFCEACLWDLPESVQATDYGFCTDVLEHIPTDKVDEVFSGIAARTLKKCYFQIALFHDSHFTQAGTLHLSVFKPDWWESRVLRHFARADFRMVRTKHLLAVAES
jgi:SAM-dependent methyltransferase